MRAKPVIPRELANQDVDKTIQYHQNEGAESVAVGFIAGVEQAYARIGRQPGIGSPRYAHELDLPGLRVWPLKRYPHLVFYVERPDHIDVWRVLHGKQHIPAWMDLDGKP